MKIIKKFIKFGLLESLYDDVTLVCEKLRFNDFKSEEEAQMASECYDKIRENLSELESLSLKLRNLFSV